MSKILFTPFGILAGVLAGVLARRTFDAAWRVVDDEPAPEPRDRGISVGKLALALVLQGAIARAVHGLLDHGARRAFTNLTGRWPGETSEQAQ